MKNEAIDLLKECKQILLDALYQYRQLEMPVSVVVTQDTLRKVDRYIEARTPAPRSGINRTHPPDCHCTLCYLPDRTNAVMTNPTEYIPEPSYPISQKTPDSEMVDNDNL